MYWSAALSLKTSRDAQHLANYGSFGTSSNSSSTSSSRSCSRSSSGSNIRIPQSIPEHQCILQFAEPRLQHYEEEKLAEYYEMEQAANYANSYNDNAATTTVTVTASKTLQMLLLSSQKLEEFVKSGTSSTTNATASTRSSSYTNKNGFSYTNAYSNDHQHQQQQQHSSSHNPDVFSYLNGSFASETTSLIGAARAAGEDDDHEQVNYWVLERERLRAKRERRILTSLFKKTAAHADDEPTSAWRTGAIMCSVPLILIILFVIFILVTGGESGDAAAVGASASSAWGIVVRTVAGASGSRSAAALRGSV